jgi:hypothetical protein
MRFDIDVFTFKLNFDVDILAIFGSATVLATFKKELALFSSLWVALILVIS